jgi:hypothetical protein
MAIWGSCIAKYLLAIRHYFIAKCMLATWRHPIAKHTLAILATSHRLNRNDRVSSLYWTRGSKLCFLTCFSYFRRYFLILVFLQNRCLLIYLQLFWLHINPISRLVFSYLWHSKLVCCKCAPFFFGTECMGFSKQDAHGNLVVDSLPVIFPLSAFCQRFLVQMSLGQTQIIHFLLTKILELTLSRVT